MALKATTARSVGRLIRIFEYFFYGSAAMISFAVGHDAETTKSQAPQWVKDSVSFIHNFGGSWLWVIAALAAFMTFFRKFIGPKEVWNAVHTLLNDFRDRAFESLEDPHANRVTLFRHQQWCFKATAWIKMVTQGKWIWGGWLVPVERSGDMTQNPRVAFYAPMDEPHKAEGFAGIVARSKTSDLKTRSMKNTRISRRSSKRC